MAALAMPLFFFWQISATTVFVPITSAIAKMGVEQTFSQIISDVTYAESENNIEIMTRMFTASKPWPNNSFKPDLTIEGKTTISVSHVQSYTMGLPLFWLFVLLLSPNKSVQLLKGTTIILISAAAALFIKMDYEIIKSLQDAPILLRILTDEGYIQLPPSVPIWLPKMFELLKSITVVIVMFILPMFLAYLSMGPTNRFIFVPETPEKSEDEVSQ
jgi:hypothetical protein